jgi:uncharacterized protein (TIGR03067 family)
VRRKFLKRYILLALATFVLTAGAAPREATEADDLKKMQGDWMVVSMTANGMRYPDEEAQALFRTIEGNNYQISRYSKPFAKGTFKIDPAATPKTIDSSPATDPSKPLLGIYEFEGENLKVCNAQPGKPRPSDFEAKAGSGHTLTVWQPETK